jgi:hypothetical protein
MGFRLAKTCKATRVPAPTAAVVLLNLPRPTTQKSAVLCTQPPAGEHDTKKADDARQPKKASKTKHTQAPRDTSACPHHPATRATPPHRTLTFCAPHTHPLLPHSNGFCAVWVCMRDGLKFKTTPYIPVRSCLLHSHSTRAAFALRFSARARW